jgi:hypothetical protein
MYPSASLICCTYNRAPDRLFLLEEVVESYRRMAVDYPGELELLVLNDAAGQLLTCAVPGVRIVNVDVRYPTLGDKLNAAIGMTTSDLIFPQDDDDISLAHRARLSVERLGDADAFNPRSQWVFTADKIYFESEKGVAHNASCFRRSAWEAVGRYPPISGGQDTAMDIALHKGHVARGPLTPEETFYCYRWGVGSDFHLSAFHSGQLGHANQAYENYGKKPIVPGVFRLRSVWYQAYDEIVQRLCRQLAKKV